MNTIDNSALIPPYLPDEDVQMEGWHPDWVKSLIMAQMRVESATDEGTLQAAVKVLNHYQEMGVNALWLTPVQDKGTSGNGYSNMGVHTIDPKLTGKDNYEDGWRVFKEFVDEAHKRDIRIYIDLIVWGTVKESPLVNEHPDWYKGFLDVWGGYKWNWYSESFREWFTDWAVKIVTETGIDGYRVDLEPFVTGHTMFAQLRKRLLSMGRKISIFAECTSERDEAYDFDEQITNEDPERWHMHTMFTKRHNIVDSVKNGWGHGTIYSQDRGEGGKARFYCLCLSCHDNPRPCIEGNKVTVGYQGIFGPYIPLWFIGDDWINPIHTGCGMFNNIIEWNLLDQPENRAFYESFKKLIGIRRSFPEIFEYFPENHRDSNICKVESNCGLQAYARFFGGRAILILPNFSDVEIMAEASFNRTELGLPENSPLTIKELFLENGMQRNSETSFTVKIPEQSLAVILVEKK